MSTRIFKVGLVASAMLCLSLFTIHVMAAEQNAQKVQEGPADVEGIRPCTCCSWPAEGTDRLCKRCKRDRQYLEDQQQTLKEKAKQVERESNDFEGTKKRGRKSDEEPAYPSSVLPKRPRSGAVTDLAGSSLPLASGVPIVSPCSSSLSSSALGPVSSAFVARPLCPNERQRFKTAVVVPWFEKYRGGKFGAPQVVLAQLDNGLWTTLGGKRQGVEEPPRATACRTAAAKSSNTMILKEHKLTCLGEDKAPGKDLSEEEVTLFYASKISEKAASDALEQFQPTRGIKKLGYADASKFLTAHVMSGRYERFGRLVETRTGAIRKIVVYNAKTKRYTTESGVLRNCVRNTLGMYTDAFRIR
ncbi:MAG: hypothetical protein RLZ12_1005 [Bacillota bacterium]